MEFVLGTEKTLDIIKDLPPKKPFSDEAIEFCQIVSKQLMGSSLCREYPDIMTLGFWLRKGSLLEYKKTFCTDSLLHVGRGVIFHVAPSNVPVNFAYSLFTGLLCGNCNVVRIPSKDFPQIRIIVDAIKAAIEEFEEYEDRICLVRYGHEQKNNDALSHICDVRVIWGGDSTIEEIRKSPLAPRSIEVTFSDRYSLAVIDKDYYERLDDKKKEQTARSFYNDTYLSDQNACTSPRLVYWYGDKNDLDEARTEFWDRLWNIVKKEYSFQDIQGIDKLTKRYILASKTEETIYTRNNNTHYDNRLVIVDADISTVDKELFSNSGYFLECIGDDISDLYTLCNDNRAQTIGYLGDRTIFDKLINLGIKGVDRIVPIGKTMDFDFIWDGYNLFDSFTRKISIK